MQEQPPDYSKVQPDVNYGYPQAPQPGYAPPPQPGFALTAQPGYDQPPQQPGYNPGYGHAIQAQPSNTTVVIQQPMTQQPLRAWKSGLFDCFDDFTICLCGTFCGLCLACQVATDMGESMCVPLCVQQSITVLRTKWRAQHNIEGTIMNDCLLDAFCGPCALCQLAREVKTARATGQY